jgi:DNA-binding response OmpR family regulator
MTMSSLASCSPNSSIRKRLITPGITPHLLILDYDLPDMNGLEMHDQLHALERLRNVPTLLISAIKPPMQEVRKRAITFLAKPLDLIELLRAIRRLLR